MEYFNFKTYRISKGADTMDAKRAQDDDAAGGGGRCRYIPLPIHQVNKVLL